MVTYKAECDKYKKDLLLIITTNFCAKKFVQQKNAELLAGDRDGMADRLGQLRADAVKFTTEHPDNSKLTTEEMEKSTGIKKEISEINRKIENFDIISSELAKFDDRIKEAIYIYKNFDEFSKEVEKLIK